MGEELVKEGFKNLDLAARGGAGVFDSSSTDADVYRHAIRGVIQAPKQLHEGIDVPSPTDKPKETIEDLHKLTKAELNKYFEKTLIKENLKKLSLKKRNLKFKE